MATVEKEKDTRLHVRASPEQKELLARAARIKHLNVTQFVMQTCLEAAEKLVQEQNNHAASVIGVSVEHYDWLMQKLDEPPQDNLELRKLLLETPRWND